MSLLSLYMLHDDFYAVSPELLTGYLTPYSSVRFMGRELDILVILMYAYVQNGGDVI